jgi:spore maturation protein CgeB
LNIHSLHALNSLNQRDFNCPLLGGFLLTDWVDGADAFFEPDREMAFYYDLDDLEEKIRFYLDHPEARNEIIQRGRERVLREHIYAKRVPRVLDILKKRIRERYLFE